MWRDADFRARNRRIFEEELAAFLPARILDFHVHIFDHSALPPGETWSCAGHPIAAYDYADFAADLADVYPERETSAVCFGLPNLRFDKGANDRYVAQARDRTRWFPLRLYDPRETDIPALRREILENGFLGLKPYLDYVRKADLNQVEIHEMLPAPVMEMANELRLIVMLHIPRKERLADPCNQRQIVELCQRYPRVSVVLAHIGRAYYLKSVVGHLDRLKDLPNLYYDLAMVNHWEVMEYLFQTVPADRILYGTDIPIALAPGKSVEINDQYTYVTPVPWSLSISDDHGKIIFTSFLYEELRAIRRAVERSGKSREFVQALFFDNGMRVLRNAVR